MKTVFENYERKSGYITYTDRYNDIIHTGLGSWIDLKTSDLPIVIDIIHNVPLSAYNYEGKCRVGLSLVTVMFQPQMLHQAIDIVMESFTIKSGFPLEENEKIVHNKREFFESLMRNTKIINIVKPKNNCSVKEQLEFYQSMIEYKHCIVRWMKRKSYDFLAEFLRNLNKYAL